MGVSSVTEIRMFMFLERKAIRCGVSSLSVISNGAYSVILVEARGRTDRVILELVI